MKRANEILNKVKSNPYFKSVHKYSCFNKLLSSLPPRFQDAIAFFYIKNGTLFGGLSHPGYKMELNYNKDLIKSLLSQIATYDKDCKKVFEGIDDVQFFVSKFYQQKDLKLDLNTIPFYQELSSGKFDIKVKNEKLKEIFLKIKEDIEKNRV